MPAMTRRPRKPRPCPRWPPRSRRSRPPPARPRKSAILEALLRRADPLSAKSIVKVLGGDLRIGLREGLVEAAIAKAFDRPLDDVKWAGMLIGDVGRLAELARDDKLADASLDLFHPLQFMLASPAEDAAEIITPARARGLGRGQVRRDPLPAPQARRGRPALLARPERHQQRLPGDRRGRRPLPWDGILDGEILGWRDGLVLPFIALQARLGRKVPSAAILAEVPVIFVAFDVLAVGPGGRPTRSNRCCVSRSPPVVRGSTRWTCRATADGGRFARSLVVSASDADAIEAAFEASRARRNEGLMVKDPDSIYAPGRRGLGWLKMKKALATIDCVVVGVEVGHGKRHGVLSDYTFAVRDTATDRLVNIGKAYSGLTDAEIAEMTRWFEAHTISRHGRYRVVEPTVVVEIAFDVIVRSARHGSGFSLRFPRIAALRPDKSVDEIDTVESVTALFEGLQHGSELLVTAGQRSTGRSSRPPHSAQPPS